MTVAPAVISSVADVLAGSYRLRPFFPASVFFRSLDRVSPGGSTGRAAPIAVFNPEVQRQEVRFSFLAVLLSPFPSAGTGSDRLAGCRVLCRRWWSHLCRISCRGMASRGTHRNRQNRLSRTRPRSKEARTSQMRRDIIISNLTSDSPEEMSFCTSDL